MLSIIDFENECLTEFGYKLFVYIGFFLAIGLFIFLIIYLVRKLNK